jgi:hypothetical protein
MTGVKLPPPPRWESDQEASKNDSADWWDAWTRTVDWAYRTKAELEARLQDGIALSSEDESSLAFCNQMVSVYMKDGLKRGN